MARIDASTKAAYAATKTVRGERGLCTFFGERWTLGGLVAFHTAHKLEVLAHSPRAYAELGRIIAHARGRDRADLQAEYAAAFIKALSKPATVAGHVNVLQHIAGYFRAHLNAEGVTSWRR